MIHKVKHILFDLDGTIINSEASILNSVKYAVSELSLNSEAIHLSHYIGLPLKYIFMQVLNTSDECLLSQAISLYRRRFAEHGFMENELYPEVLDTLYLLKQKAIKIYIATSKPTVFAKQILKYLGVINMFSEVYGSELDGENTDKTELINYIINSIGHKRSEIMMIGDRKYDIIGAKNNRIMSAGVTYGYGSMNELMREKPDYLFSSLSELPERILLCIH